MIDVVSMRSVTADWVIQMIKTSDPRVTPPSTTIFGQCKSASRNMPDTAQVNNEPGESPGAIRVFEDDVFSP